MVKVVLNGKGDLKKVSIDKTLMDPEETEVLEDLIVAAFTDAKAKVESHAATEMAKITGGLQLPAGHETAVLDLRWRPAPRSSG